MTYRTRYTPRRLRADKVVVTFDQADYNVAVSGPSSWQSGASSLMPAQAPQARPVET
jgi:hypothetical protein